MEEIIKKILQSNMSLDDKAALIAKIAEKQSTPVYVPSVPTYPVHPCTPWWPDINTPQITWLGGHLPGDATWNTVAESNKAVTVKE